MRCVTTRHGMTLVEVLVGITIVAMLFAIAVPAVNSAMESSRRTRCQATQTNFALAMGRYDAQKDVLPGWRNKMSIAGIPSTGSWFVELLPYLERKDVHSGILSGDVWSVAWNAHHSGHMLLNLTRCPSMPVEQDYRDHRMQYLANAGVAGAAGGSTNDGALGDNANDLAISLEDIRSGDGLSHTLLISETTEELYWPPFSVTVLKVDDVTPCDGGTAGEFTMPGTSTWARHCAADASGFSGSVSFGAATWGVTYTPPSTISAPVAADAQVINNTAVFRSETPSSRHPGGVVASFVDGSTRFLKDELPPHVYGHLVTSLSVYDDAGPSNQKYGTNSLWSNRFLMSPSGPVPYALLPTDY